MKIIQVLAERNERYGGWYITHWIDGEEQKRQSMLDIEFTKEYLEEELTKMYNRLYNR